MIPNFDPDKKNEPNLSFYQQPFLGSVFLIFSLKIHFWHNSLKANFYSMQFRYYGTLTYLYGRVFPSESQKTFKVLEKRTLPITWASFRGPFY